MDTVIGVFQRTFFCFSLLAVSANAHAIENRYGEHDHHHRNQNPGAPRVPTPASVQNTPVMKVLEAVGSKKSSMMRSGRLRSPAAIVTPPPILVTPEPTPFQDPTGTPVPSPKGILIPTATPTPTAPLPPPPPITPSPVPTVIPITPTPTPTAPVGCQCGTGYAPTADGVRCVKMSNVPANPPVPGPVMVRGDENGNYESNIALVDSGLSSLPSGNSSSAFQMIPGAWNDFMPQVNFTPVSSSNMLLPAGPTTPNWQFFWRRFGDYSHNNPNGMGSYGTSKLALKIGGGNPMQSSAAGSFTKSYCVNVPVEKSYLIHVGADNNWKVKVNGSPYAECNDSYCHKSGFFIKQVFPAGKSVVELQYTNEGGYAGIWFEILDNGLEQIKTATHESQLNKVFSTAENPNGSSWDYSTANSPCPAGYSYNRCESTPVCTKVEYDSCH